MTRITISLDSSLARKISEFLEEMQIKAGKSWSLSKTINLLILSGMLCQKKHQAYDWAILKEFTKGKRGDIESIDLEEVLINMVVLDETSFTTRS